MIEREMIRSGPGQCAISKARDFRLETVKEYLLSKGFPTTQQERHELSLHPWYFQEVNYDDLDIYSITGDAGHLTNVYELDLAVQTGGYTKADLSKELFDLYVAQRSAAIEYWKEKGSKQERRESIFRKIVGFLKR